jgi:hypothetical protein
MGLSARIFFAGVGTTFIILALGFGCDWMLAKSAIHAPFTQVQAGLETQSKTQSGMRVILASSAEPAVRATETPGSEQRSQENPALIPMPVVEKQSLKVDGKKTNEDLRERRRKRYAEREAKWIASRAVTSDSQRRSVSGLMAFGSEESRNFFGN